VITWHTIVITNITGFIMAISGKERQKKWQDKQKAFGKKRFTIVIDKAAAEILNTERDKTGNSLSDIVNSIIMKHGNTTGSFVDEENLKTESNQNYSEINNAPVSTNKTSGPAKQSHEKRNVVSTNQKNGLQEIINRITTLIGVIELSAGEVADRFNKEGLATTDGSHKWNEEMVLDLYEDEIL
jgi:hypothetical protein